MNNFWWVDFEGTSLVILFTFGCFWCSKLFVLEFFDTVSLLVFVSNVFDYVGYLGYFGSNVSFQCF